MPNIHPHLWVNGLCSTFAAAIKARYGGDLWAMVNHSHKYPQDDCLLHCFCVINNIAYDGNGPNDVERVSDTKQWSIPEMDSDNDCIILWRQVDEAWFDRHHEDYNPNDFPEVYAYVERNWPLFKGITAN
jgi:hypothetical protein